jgi:hypothetical protein
VGCGQLHPAVITAIQLLWEASKKSLGKHRSTPQARNNVFSGMIWLFSIQASLLAERNIFKQGMISSGMIWHLSMQEFQENYYCNQLEKK